MRGSVLVFPTFTLLWDVHSVTEISVASLSPVHLLRPAVNLLLVGTGADMRTIHPELYGYFARRGVAIEPMATKHAISTFNVLNGDGRDVAAALLSPEPLTRDEACLYLSGSPYIDPDAIEASRRLEGDGGENFEHSTLADPSEKSGTPIVDDMMRRVSSSNALRRSHRGRVSQSPYVADNDPNSKPRSS
jgi:NADH dehydrogenase [ubiquinone] 1 alpha subcomplex assembly factor 3